MSPIVSVLLSLLAVSGLVSEARAQLPSRNAEASFAIQWEVKNRFRLFRNEADFKRHKDAGREGVLAAERRLSLASDGRGWAKDMLESLCLDASGRVTETCQRDGEKENYLTPTEHRIGIVLAGRVDKSATCAWSFNDGVGDPREIAVPCHEEVRLRVAYGRPTIVSVNVISGDTTLATLSNEILVRDFLIAGLGDSIASGEGNPDRAVQLEDTGFCFRRFGPGVNQFFRPSRANYQGDRSCEMSVGQGVVASNSGDWARSSARWLSAACHRSLYSYQLRAALGLAVAEPHVAVTFIPLACTGATIEAGLLAGQRGRECAGAKSCSLTVPGQIAQLTQTLAAARKSDGERRLDLLLLTIGANDIDFSGMVADVIVDAATERGLFNRAGLLTSVDAANGALESRIPKSFAKLRAALKPLVGGDLSRVVYVNYGNPALQGPSLACAGGRDGFDVHPAFTADPARLERVASFVSNRFLPRMRALAQCEAGSLCADQRERMSLVEAHQAAFATRGFCARSDEDPIFDRICFSPNGDSFETNLVAAARDPLVCQLRPTDFRPYAPRARWIRTANDSYFTAMTYPEGMPNLQPSDIHDATWGAMSAVYGGAIHPTAEGHAAMADAAIPEMRRVLRLTVAEPPIVSQPLPGVAPLAQ